MVAKMKKITFLVYHNDYGDFLQDLQELGMIHVVEKDEKALNQEELQQFTAESRLLTEAKKKLEKLVDKKTYSPTKNPRPNIGREIPEKIAEIDTVKSTLSQQLQVILRERNALRPWGNFDPSYLKLLKEAGYFIHFFITPDRNYNPKWEEQYNALIIQKEASKTYFITISKNMDLADQLNLEEMKYPELSLKELDQITEELHRKIEDQDEAMKKLTDELPSLDAALSELNTKIIFSRVAHSATSLADEKIKLLQGWVPQEKESEITTYLTSKEVYFETADPEPEDDVPIKFSNNRFTRLFEPIAELYMLPKYNEIDLTPFFAPFYMVFFGLSLGDIGYGTLLLLASTIAMIFIKKKKEDNKTMKGALRLVQVLGAATMLCGLLTGGFFGFNIYETNITFFQKMKEQVFFDNQRMFGLSLVLGVIQILFGMTLKIFNRIRQFGFIHALSTIGWVTLLLSLVVAYLLPAIMPMGGTAHMIVIGLSSILIFFFNAPGKNPLLNLGLGLYDTYNMATGLLGDVLSYVRLFALGLSGGILASVFNSLALGLKPDNVIVGSLVFLVIFLFGHAMNIFMNVLGAIVHPMRLTFVEFYKNAEFTGGGERYNPFRK